MPDITFTVSADWVTRFDAYARDARPWGDRPGEIGPDTRTTNDLYKLLEVGGTKNRILNFERNNRAEFGGVLPPNLGEPS